MKNNALMFVINEKMVFALGTVLINLKEVCPKLLVDIVVIHDGLSNEAMRDLSNINKKITFLKYTLDDFISEHDIDDHSESFKYFIDRYSFLALIKYKIFGMLNHYKSILFLDVDILILKDISKIFEQKGVSWRNGFSLKEKLSKNKINKDFSFLKEISEKAPAPNGGLIFVEDSIPYNEMQLISKNFISENYSIFTAHIDEISIALPTELLKVKLNILSNKEFNVLPELTNDDSMIIHFIGKKLWDSYELTSIFPEWMKYYHIWIKNSSHIYPNIKKINRGDFLKKINYNDFWLKSQNLINLPNELAFSNMTKNHWYPIFLKEEESNFYYELKKGKDENHFKIGVWFKNKAFTNLIFANRIIKKIESFNFINYKLDENVGLYLITTDIHYKKLNENFHLIYNLTFNEYKSESKAIT